MAVVVSAVATAIEVGTLAAALTAVATVGTAMTVVGIVTKSKELTKVGGTLALVGGIGGLVNAGVAGLAAGAAGAGVAEGAAAGAFSDVAGEQFAQSVGMDAAGSGFGAAADGVGGALAGAGDASAGLIGANGGLNSFLSQSAPAASASGVPGIVPDATGAIATDSASPFLNDYGLPAGGATDKVLSAASPADFSGSIADASTYQPADVMAKYGTAQLSLTDKLGAAWKGLGPAGQAIAMKAAMAMPGGIQNQKNVEAAMRQQQERIDQTSHGSQVPTFGIIQKAQKGGLS